jgi:hypothetical protein
MLALHNLLQWVPDEEVTALAKQNGEEKRFASYPFYNPSSRQHAAILLGVPHLQETFPTLSLLEQSLIRYIISQGGYEERERLLMQFPDSSVALERLKSLFLIFENPTMLREGRSILFAPAEWAQVIALSADERSTLGFLLESIRTDYHARLATRYHLRRGRKFLTVLDARAKFSQPEFLQEAINELSIPEKKLFDRCLDQEGVLSAEDIRSLGGDPWMFSTYTARNLPFHNLFERGLLFPAQGDPYISMAMLVPSDVYLLLRPPKVETSISMPASRSSPSCVRSHGLRLGADVRMISIFASSGRVRITQQGNFEKRSVDQLVKALKVDDPDYSAFLAQAAKPCCGSKNGALDFWGKEPAKTHSRLVAGILEDDTWTENSPKGLGKYQVDGTIVEKRSRICRVLSGLPVNQWVERGALWVALPLTGWRRAEAFEPSNNSYAASKPASRNIEQTFLRILTDTLVWCGIIELGYAAGEEDKAKFSHARLTSWGAWILSRDSRPFDGCHVPQIEERFRILPNHDIVIPPRLDAGLLTQLFQIADLYEPASFRPGKASLQAALDAGWTTEKIVSFLRDNSVTGLPETVEQYIRETAEKHGHVRVGVARLYIETDDHLTLLELRARKELKPFILKLIGECVLVLRWDNPERVVRLLKKLGYMPVIDKENEEEVFWRARFR